MYKHAISLTCPNADTTVKDLATLQSSCPAVTPGIDGNYFSIASQNLLGTAQAVQFQSGDQKGADYHWTSKFNESGEKIVSSDSTNASPANKTPGRSTWYINGTWLEQNERSAISRSYQNEHGILYDWYAAVAESNSNQVYASFVASDSLCPSGWKMPNSGSDAPSYRNLLTSAYAISGNNGSQAFSTFLRSFPQNVELSGRYDLNGGGYETNSGFILSNRIADGDKQQQYVLDMRGGTSAGYDGRSLVLYGTSIRCVRSD